MSGLDLLGMVCVDKLKEEVKQSQEYMEVTTDEDEENNKTGSVIEMNNSEVMTVIKQEIDPSTIKSEVEDIVIIDPLYNDFNTSTMERASSAVSTYLNINDFGNFMFKIFENQFCKFSKFTGWHLQRSQGIMKINMKFHKLPASTGPLRVGAILVRKDETYRHFGVDKICENHRKEVGAELAGHVLQPAPGLDSVAYLDSDGQRNSVCFQIGRPNPSGQLEATIGLKCICNDSCSTCDDHDFRPTESSRDLLLVLTLESVDYGVVLARRAIGIWPKAIVRPKDLNKPERRKPKGGAAQLNKKKEWLEKIKHLETANSLLTSQQQASQLPSPSSSPQSSQESSTSSQSSSQQSSSQQSTPSQSDEKVCKLILKIPTKNKLPTTEEILKPSLNFVVKNAKKAGYSKEQLFQMITETYDQIPNTTATATNIKQEEQ